MRWARAEMTLRPKNFQPDTLAHFLSSSADLRSQRTLAPGSRRPGPLLPPRRHLHVPPRDLRLYRLASVLNDVVPHDEYLDEHRVPYVTACVTPFADRGAAPGVERRGGGSGTHCLCRPERRGLAAPLPTGNGQGFNRQWARVAAVTSTGLRRGRWTVADRERPLKPRSDDGTRSEVTTPRPTLSLARSCT